MEMLFLNSALRKGPSHPDSAIGCWNGLRLPGMRSSPISAFIAAPVEQDHPVGLRYNHRKLGQADSGVLDIQAAGDLRLRKRAANGDAGFDEARAVNVLAEIPEAGQV